MKPKMLVDLAMTLLLPCLMAYQIIDGAGHEWLGTGMLLLFLIHNFLNRGWYGRLFRGKYRLARVLQTAVNFGALAAMLLSGYSGIVLSRHVFPVVHGPMATARRMHMAASYWCFLLMSLHLGMHWAMIRGMLTKAIRHEPSVSAGKVLRLLALAACAFGMYCFFQNGIPAYLFLRKEFVFFNFEKSAIWVFLEYIGILFSWAAMGNCVLEAARKSRKDKHFL